jgi:hypothetical protein
MTFSGSATEVVIPPAGTWRKFRPIARIAGGNAACAPRDVLFKAATRTTLILIPLFTSAARLHAHAIETPLAVTQELNRCLMMVRTAASRRGAQHDKHATPPRSSRACGYSAADSPAMRLY